MARDTMRTIFHPTDFSRASAVAYVHALKLAQLTRSDLTVFHAGAKTDESSSAEAGFPRVRAPLERWGLLPQHSEPSDVAQLGFSVRKVEIVGDDPTATALAYVAGHDIDLMALATHQRTGVDRWRHGSVAELLAREASTVALFMPAGVAGFIEEETGRVGLERIVIRVDRTPGSRAAIDAAANLVRDLDCERVDVTLVHVGDDTSEPLVDLPPHTACHWRHERAPGDVPEQILRVADEQTADLIVTAADARQGVLDSLLDSPSEELLRTARCPVLAVPDDPDG